jgi:hypothetical protein
VAVQQNALTITRVTGGFHAMLTGKAPDHNAVLQFTQADAQTQAQIIKNLASGPVPAEVAHLESSLSTAVPRVASAQAHITAEAHWWGFQIFIPEPIMKQLATASSLFSTILGLLTPVLVGPLAAVLVIVAGYVAAELAAMKAVDKGKGVELSATWLAPVVLVPSAL